MSEIVEDNICQEGINTDEGIGRWIRKASSVFISVKVCMNRKHGVVFIERCVLIGVYVESVFNCITVQGSARNCNERLLFDIVSFNWNELLKKKTVSRIK